MGIELLIVKLLRKVCPDAFSNLAPNGKAHVVQLVKQWNESGLGDLEDCMLKLNKVWSPTNDHLFSGIEFLDAMVKSAAKAIQCHNGKLIVRFFDDPFNTPKQKAATQKKRSYKNKADAYSNNSTIDDHGIREPGESVSKRFDERRLFATRALRPRLFAYIAQNAHKAPCLNQYRLKEGTQLLFNICSTGPHLLKINTETGTFMPAVHLPHLAHGHGESDVSLFYFIDAQLTGKHTLVRTVDSDFYPMAFKQLQHRLKNADDKGTISLETQDGKDKEVIVDMRYLTKYAMIALKMTPDSFMFFCVVMGNDYFEKKRILHQVKFKSVQSSIADLSPDITTVWGSLLPRKPERGVLAAESAKRLKSLRVFLYDVYWHREPTVQTMYRKEKGFGATPRNYDELYEGILPAVARAIQAETEEKKKPEPKSKKRKASEDDNDEKEEKHTRLRPPAPESLEEVVVDIWWNMRYWSGENNPVLRDLYYGSEK